MRYRMFLFITEVKVRSLYQCLNSFKIAMLCRTGTRLAEASNRYWRYGSWTDWAFQIATVLLSTCALISKIHILGLRDFYSTTDTGYHKDYVISYYARAYIEILPLPVQYSEWAEVIVYIVIPKRSIIDLRSISFRLSVWGWSEYSHSNDSLVT